MTVPQLDNEAIFHAARDIPSPDQRREYVRQACGGDETRISHVEALLAAAEVPDSLLDSPAGRPSLATIDELPAERPGAVIGPYKLLQQIGEGGMGIVWMVEQTQPVQRKVALKVIKPGMDSRQVIARFEAERQALAMMDHVNIARVFDGGATVNGRPYFVMELVHGVPITKYCDDKHLSPRERLELFVPVCQAIQHAHQKGVIHRDIKPSNVMVTLYDGQPVPKVIDFGVAKATEQKLTERTLFTHFGAMVGTLEYMSPEQAEMSALGVDTRSDVYSLGVLLYELLAGSTPLTRQRFKDVAYGEILRIIKEEEPPMPSTRLSDSGAALASISANRHTEPAKLTKLVRGELDWIVMKCLDKDRNRRYDTAKDVAADIQRYLNDEPIQARPITVLQRMWRVCRRRASLIAGGYTVVTFAILAVTVVLLFIVQLFIGKPHASEFWSGFGSTVVSVLLCLAGAEMGVAAFRGKRRGLWMSLVAFIFFCVSNGWLLFGAIAISRDLSDAPMYSVPPFFPDTVDGRSAFIRDGVIRYAVSGLTWSLVGLVLQVHALWSRAADQNLYGRSG